MDLDRATSIREIRESFIGLRKCCRSRTPGRSAGFQTCRVADFQVGGALVVVRPAGLETRDTADWEVCATLVAASPRCVHPRLMIFLSGSNPVSRFIA